MWACIPRRKKTVYDKSKKKGTNEINTTTKPLDNGSLDNDRLGNASSCSTRGSTYQRLEDSSTESREAQGVNKCELSTEVDFKLQTPCGVQLEDSSVWFLLTSL